MRIARTLLFLSLAALSPLVANLPPRQCTWVTEAGVRALMRNHRGGFGGVVFHPIGQNKTSLAFTQAEFGWFQDLYDFSLGFGYRRRQACNWAWGANIFGDYGLSAQDDSFFQLGVGGELFGPCWIARANGYFPKRRKILVGIDRELLAQLGQPQEVGVEILDASFDLCDFSRTYPGFDIEFGAMCDLGPAELWGFVKGFYYKAPGVEPITGPQFRVMYRTKPLPGWGAEIYFGAEWSWERLRNGQGAAFVGFRMPLCAWNYPICGGTRKGPWDCWDNITRHMNWDVGRHPAIFTEVERDQIFLPMDVIGQAVFLDAIGGGTGTLANPTDVGSITTSDFDLLFFLGEAGDIPIGGVITMVDGQSIAGFAGETSTTVPVVGGHLLTIDALNGPQAVLANLDAGGGQAIALPGGGATDLTIQGIGIITSTTGIGGSGFDSLLIDRVTILSPTVTAIDLSDWTGTATIQNSSLDGTAAGISLEMTAGGLDGTALVTDNEISNFDTPIDMEVTAASTLRVLISDNTISGATTTAVQGTTADGNLYTRILDNTLLNNAAGVTFDATSTSIGDEFLALISGNAFTNTAAAAVDATFFGGPGLLSVIVETNTDTVGNDAVAPYQFEQTVATGAVCTAFTGNNTDRTTKEVIFANVPGGVLQVEDLGDIAENNNEITPVTPDASVQDVPLNTCPSPPPIP